MIFSDEMAARICAEIAAGKSLLAICKPKEMPVTSTVYKWLGENGAFKAMYLAARDQQADLYADEIIEIADTAEDAALGRLRVDARKWKASKLAPKKYGDKVSHEHGGDGGGPIKTEITVSFVKSSENRDT